MRWSSYPRCSRWVHRTIVWLICFANQPFIELWPTSPAMGMEVVASFRGKGFAAPKYRPSHPAIYKRIPLHNVEDQLPYGCGVALCKAIQALTAFCGGSTPPWSELCFFFFASFFFLFFSRFFRCGFNSSIQALHSNGTSRGLFARLLHWLHYKYGYSFWLSYQITVIWRLKCLPYKLSIHAQENLLVYKCEKY